MPHRLAYEWSEWHSDKRKRGTEWKYEIQGSIHA